MFRCIVCISDHIVRSPEEGGRCPGTGATDGSGWPSECVNQI